MSLRVTISDEELDRFARAKDAVIAIYGPQFEHPFFCENDSERFRALAKSATPEDVQTDDDEDFEIEEPRIGDVADPADSDTNAADVGHKARVASAIRRLRRKNAARSC